MTGRKKLLFLSMNDPDLEANGSTVRAGQFVSAREISDSYPVPKRLLAEVLKDLSRTGLVESLRGSAGSGPEMIAPIGFLFELLVLVQDSNRRSAFHGAHKIRYRHLGWNQNKQVHMINLNV